MKGIVLAGGNIGLIQSKMDFEEGLKKTIEWYKGVSKL